MTYNGCIHPFGLTKDIWKTFVINDEELNADARRFYESYSMVSDELNKENGWGVSSTWDEREINGIRNDNYKIRCKARRQKMQDYSNSLHKSTKLHNCIRPYNELDEITKHYAWLVVKNSL